MKAKHLKTGKIYEVVSTEIINATNDQDGQVMVLYFGDKKDGSGKSYFVRELNEFKNSFCDIGKEGDIYDITTRVLGIINTHFRPDEDQKPEYSLVNDVGLDSLDIVEFIMYVEDEFSISIDDNSIDELNNNKTVAEFCEWLYNTYYGLNDNDAWACHKILFWGDNNKNNEN